MVVLGLGLVVVIIIVVVASLLPGSESGSGGSGDTGGGGSTTTLSAADETFLGALNSRGVQYTSQASAINEGQAVCQRFAGGNDVLGEVTHFKQEGYSDFEAGFIVGAAVNAYCPQYRSLLGN